MEESFPEQEMSYVGVERLLTAVARARAGDFSGRMVPTAEGLETEVAEAVNEILSFNARLAEEIKRISEAVVQGDLKVRTRTERASGAWLEQLRALDTLVTTFDRHASEVRHVVKAVTTGDFGRTIAVGKDATHRSGELSQLAEDINGLTALLQSVVADITRVVGEVAVEGKLDARSRLPTMTGAWARLVDATNGLSTTFFAQIQDLTATAQALANGQLLARVSAGCSGDLQVLKIALNSAIESMSGLCGDLHRVAYEVTNAGKLTASLRQAELRGEWQTAQAACNRTLSLLGAALRSVGEGLEQLLLGQHSVGVDTTAPGEIGQTLRSLVRLAEQEKRTQHGITTLLHGRFSELAPKGSERDVQLFLLGVRLKQDWIRAARVGLVEARERARSHKEFATAALQWIAQTVDAAAGAYYVVQPDELIVQLANFGCELRTAPISSGEGLVGRVAVAGKPTLLDKLDDRSVRIAGGISDLVPRAVLLYPVMQDTCVLSVLELCFVGTGAANALELLDALNPDLAGGARKLFEQSGEQDDSLRQRVRQLEEDLLIANTRLQAIGQEKRQRERLAEVTRPMKVNE